MSRPFGLLKPFFSIPVQPLEPPQKTTRTGKAQQCALSVRDRSPGWAFNPDNPPSVAQLRDPVICTMDAMTGRRAWQALQRDDVITATLSSLGLDVANLPDGWAVEDHQGRITGSLGLGRRVGQAVKTQTQTPSQGRDNAWCAIPRRGLWCLTEAGLDAAVSLADGVWPPCPRPVVLLSQSWPNLDPDDGDMLVELVEVDDDATADVDVAPESTEPPKAPRKGAVKSKVGKTRPGATLVGVGPNETAWHLDGRLVGGRKSPLWRAVTAALGNKLRVSAAAGLLDDHAQEFFLKLIRRNSLQKRLAAGTAIPDSQIASWAVRSGRSDIRNGGTEPVSRELLGARTERELSTTKAPLRWLDDADAPQVVRRKDDQGRVGLAHVIAPDTDMASFLAGDEEHILWQLLDKAFEERRPGEGKLYVGVVRMRAEGCTVKEITATHGLPDRRLQYVLADVRTTLGDIIREGGLNDLAAFNRMRLRMAGQN